MQAFNQNNVVNKRIFGELTMYTRHQRGKLCLNFYYEHLLQSNYSIFDYSTNRFFETWNKPKETINNIEISK